jgi:hypothetical protein
MAALPLMSIGRHLLVAHVPWVQHGHQEARWDPGHAFIPQGANPCPDAQSSVAFPRCVRGGGAVRLWSGAVSADDPQGRCGHGGTSLRWQRAVPDERLWRDVGAVPQPAHSPVGDRDLGERLVTGGDALEHRSPHEVRDVSLHHPPVGQGQAQAVPRERGDSFDLEHDWMLAERIDGVERLLLIGLLPGPGQLVAMDGRPLDHEPQGSRRKRSSQDLRVFDGDERVGLAVASVEMGGEWSS